MNPIRAVSPARQRIVDAISAAGVVAILRIAAIDRLAALCDALVAGGVSVIEITMTTPDALKCVEVIRSRVGAHGIVGVGTVLDAHVATDAIRAGAEFIVSPVCDPAVIRAAHIGEKPVIPGALTPSEILNAWEAGADVVKLFPSGNLPPTYLRDVLAPLPFLKIAPSGGIDAANAAAWMKAGACFVGAGSTVVAPQALASEDWHTITTHARALVDAVAQSRSA